MEIHIIDDQIDALEIRQHSRDVIDRYRYHPLTKYKQKADFNLEYNALYKTKQLTYLYMIDVIALHECNRLRGMKAGDGLITEVGESIQTFTHPSSIYHVSGDEFIVLADEELAINIPNATVVSVEVDPMLSPVEMLEVLDERMREAKAVLNRRRTDI